jgi:excinuclease ABC subunit B
MKKYGDAANLPASAMKKRGGTSSRGAASSQAGASSPSRAGASSPSPLAGSEASEARSRGRGGGSTSRSPSRVHKPHLDEMHGPESLPFRPTRALPEKPFGERSKIIQPNDSRQSGSEFGPSPRSTGGAPGHRGGWKKR